MKSIYIDDDLHGQLKSMALFENTSLSDLVKLYLKKQIQKKLEDLPTRDLQALLKMGGSFDFLDNPKEDIYSEKDGTPI